MKVLQTKLFVLMLVLVAGEFFGPITAQEVVDPDIKFPEVLQILKLDNLEANIEVKEDYNDCPETCPTHVEPICASDGSCFKTFHNPCELQKANCKRPHLTKFNMTQNSVCSVHDNPICEICPPTCVKQANPICAFNKFCYQTFNSTCEMVKRDCNNGGRDMFEVYAQGACSQDRVPNCRQVCPKHCQPEYMPVCAKRDKCFQSFYSECFLDRMNCHLPLGAKEFNYVHSGDCNADELQSSEGCDSVQS